MRVYDPRVGRFLSVDPITRQYPELTPYQFASNTPIRAVDLDGLEAADALSLKINESISTKKVPNTVTVRVYHNYKGKVSSTGLDFSMNNITHGIGRLFKKEINTVSLERSIVPDGGGGVNTVFSMAVAERDKIPENFVQTSISGVGNTFRHFLMQVVLTSGFGMEQAKKIGDLKEVDDRPMFRELTLDNKVDLINNMYGRQYAIMNKLTLSDFLVSDQASADILNKIAVHVLNSVDEYKNDPAFQNILSGKEKIFNSESEAVKLFRGSLQAFRQTNEKFLKEEERKRSLPTTETPQ